MKGLYLKHGHVIYSCQLDEPNKYGYEYSMPRGRPPFPPGERRSKALRLLVNEREERLMLDAASAMGDKKLSQWMREVLLEAAKRQLAEAKGVCAPGPTTTSSDHEECGPADTEDSS